MKNYKSLLQLQTNRLLTYLCHYYPTLYIISVKLSWPTIQCFKRPTPSIDDVTLPKRTSRLTATYHDLTLPEIGPFGTQCRGKHGLGVEDGTNRLLIPHQKERWRESSATHTVLAKDKARPVWPQMLLLLLLFIRTCKTSSMKRRHVLSLVRCEVEMTCVCSK